MRVSWNERNDAAAGLRALARAAERADKASKERSYGEPVPFRAALGGGTWAVLGVPDVGDTPATLRRLADLIDGGEFEEVRGDGKGK